ncbi:MAG: type I restriction endonuclease [Acidimicrobiales bacterium]
MGSPRALPGLLTRHGQMLGAGWRHMDQASAPRSIETLLKRDLLVEGLLRLNGDTIDEEGAESLVDQLAALTASAEAASGEPAHDQFMSWLRGEGSIAGSKVRLVDFDDLGQNTYALWTNLRIPDRDGQARHVDMLLFVNGVPTVVVETGPRSEDLSQTLPELFVPIVYSVFAGRDGGPGLASSRRKEEHVPVVAHKGDGPPAFSPLSRRTADAVTEMLRPQAVLDAIIATGTRCRAI